MAEDMKHVEVQTIDEKTEPQPAILPPPTESQNETPGLTNSQRFIVMFSLCTAVFLIALDVTIITTALPSIADHLHATPSQYTWVGSAYVLASASSTPLWGKASNIWGRRPMILASNLSFMVGSLLAALSPSMNVLIGGRVIQGLGGGGISIMVSIVIGDLFSMKERPKYFGYTAMVFALASGVGPLMGGAFSQTIGWRWCFYINLPFDGVSLVLIYFFLKVKTPATPFWDGIKAFDWIGAMLMIGGTICFIMGLDSGGVTHAWNSAYTLGLIIFGIFQLVLFWVYEWRFARYPLMPIRLISSLSNVGAFSAAFVHAFVFVAHTFYLPVYFQVVLDASPLVSGALTLILVIPLSIMSSGTGFFLKKTSNFRATIWFGLSLLTLGTGLFIDFGTKRIWWKIVVFQLLAGIGVGPLFQSPLIAVQSHLKAHDSAAAASGLNFFKNLATALSVAIGGILVQNGLISNEGTLQQTLGDELGTRVAHTTFASLAEVMKLLPDQAAVDVVKETLTLALRNTWIFYTAVAALGLALSFFITEKELSATHEEVKTGLAEEERVRLEDKQERLERRMKREGADQAIAMEKV